MQEEFDFQTFKENAIAEIKSGGSLFGKEGIMAPLLKELLEASLEGELEAHIAQDESPNRKNGKGLKRVRTGGGEIEISTPRDRNGSFSPKILPKRQKTLTQDLDNAIISLYARGSSYRDIRSHLKQIYGLEISDGTISGVTDKVWPLVEEWRSRPLDKVYPFVWLDAIHYKIRTDGKVITRAVYCILGVYEEGCKDLLGLHIGENESARFWLFQNSARRSARRASHAHARIARVHCRRAPPPADRAVRGRGRSGSETKWRACGRDPPRTLRPHGRRGPPS